FTEMDQIIDESLEMSKTMMQAFPSSVSMDEAFELVEEQMRFIKNLIPAIIILLALLLSFIGQWVSYKILNRIEQKGLKFPPFKFFNFPLSLIWVYLITIMLTFVDLDVDSTLYFVLVNAEMICVTFLTIQGFSFLFFFAHHKKWHRSIPIVLLVVSIILPFLMYIIRIVGIIDLGLSLKKKLSEQGQGK